MNKQLRLSDFEPYRPIREGVQFRVPVAFRELWFASGRAAVAADVPGEISSVFDAKENLRAVRSSVLEPCAVTQGSVRLAEQALLRQSGSDDPERVKVNINSLALDLSKILD